MTENLLDSDMFKSVLNIVSELLERLNNIPTGGILALGAAVVLVGKLIVKNFINGLGTPVINVIKNISKEFEQLGNINLTPEVDEPSVKNQFEKIVKDWKEAKSEIEDNPVNPQVNTNSSQDQQSGGQESQGNPQDPPQQNGGQESQGNPQNPPQQNDDDNHDDTDAVQQTYKLRDAFTQVATGATVAATTIAGGAKNSTVAISTLASQIPSVTSAFQTMGKKGGLAATGVALAVTAISVAVSALIDSYQDWKAEELGNQISSLTQKAEQLSNAASAAKNAFNEKSEEYDTLEGLKDTYDELAHKTYLTEEEQEEYNSMVESLKESYPELISSYDAVTGKITLQNNLLEEQLETIKEEEEIAARSSLTNTLAANRTNNQAARLQAAEDIADVYGFDISDTHADIDSILSGNITFFVNDDSISMTNNTSGEEISSAEESLFGNTEELDDVVEATGGSIEDLQSVTDTLNNSLSNLGENTDSASQQISNAVEVIKAELEAELDTFSEDYAAYLEYYNSIDEEDEDENNYVLSYAGAKAQQSVDEEYTEVQYGDGVDKGVDVAATALTGAAIGATVGFILPGIGNAVGAAVGGAIGFVGGIAVGYFSDLGAEITDGIGDSFGRAGDATTDFADACADSAQEMIESATSLSELVNQGYVSSATETEIDEAESVFELAFSDVDVTEVSSWEQAQARWDSETIEFLEDAGYSGDAFDELISSLDLDNEDDLKYFGNLLTQGWAENKIIDIQNEYAESEKGKEEIRAAENTAEELTTESGDMTYQERLEAAQEYVDQYNATIGKVQGETTFYEAIAALLPDEEEVESAYENIGTYFGAFTDKLTSDSLISASNQLESMREQLENSNFGSEQIEQMLSDYASELLSFEYSDDVNNVLLNFDYSSYDTEAEMTEALSEMLVSSGAAASEESADQIAANFAASLEDVGILDFNITSGSGVQSVISSMNDTFKENKTAIDSLTSSLTEWASNGGELDATDYLDIWENLDTLGYDSETFFDAVTLDENGDLSLDGDVFAQVASDFGAQAQSQVDALKESAEAGLAELQAKKAVVDAALAELNSSQSAADAMAYGANALIQTYNEINGLEGSDAISEVDQVEWNEEDREALEAEQESLGDQIEEYQNYLDGIDYDTLAAIYEQGYIEEFNDKVEETSETLNDDYTSALKAVEDAEESLIDAQEELNDALEDYNELLYGSDNRKSSLDNLYNYTEAINSYTNAATRAEDALGDATTIEEATAAWQDYAEAYHNVIAYTEAESQVIEEALVNYSNWIENATSSYVDEENGQIGHFNK